MSEMWETVVKQVQPLEASENHKMPETNHQRNLKILRYAFLASISQIFPQIFPIFPAVSEKLLKEISP